MSLTDLHKIPFIFEICSIHLILFTRIAHQNSGNFLLFIDNVSQEFYSSSSHFFYSFGCLRIHYKFLFYLFFVLLTPKDIHPISIIHFEDQNQLYFQELHESSLKFQLQMPFSQNSISFFTHTFMSLIPLPSTILQWDISIIYPH